ncbi:MAG: DUF4831 family protein [Bacteroidales bacterium]|jgi:hypothetical protein|nr:DUF4831 family protein [Bacteroidales bacterium]
MKKIVFIFITGLLFVVLVAQAQMIEAIKLSATKGNEYGLTYSLPNTLLIIDIQATKVTQKAGRFSQYAERYLGTQDVVLADKEYWTLDKVDVWAKGVADKEKTYIIKLKSDITPYIYVTEDGFLCSINTEPDYSLIDRAKLTLAPSVHTEKANANSAITEEFLMASSTGKMAEIAAKQIYRIRESRMNILTGEADKIPGDAESLKLIIGQLDVQEQILTEMFTGSTTKEISIRSYTYLPEDDVTNHIVCRFSKLLGPVDKNDLSGSPLFLSLRNTTTLDLPKLNEFNKNKKGIMYTVAGDVKVKITFSDKTLFENSIKISQFGAIAVLPSSIFENKKKPAKAIFYPNLGIVKEIIQ